MGWTYSKYFFVHMYIFLHVLFWAWARVQGFWFRISLEFKRKDSRRNRGANWERTKNQNSKEAVITKVTKQFWEKIWFSTFSKNQKYGSFHGHCYWPSKPTCLQPTHYNPRTILPSGLLWTVKEIKLELLWSYLLNMMRIHIVNVLNIFVKIIQGYFQMTSFHKTIRFIYFFQCAKKSENEPEIQRFTSGVLPLFALRQILMYV